MHRAIHDRQISPLVLLSHSRLSKNFIQQGCPIAAYADDDSDVATAFKSLSSVHIIGRRPDGRLSPCAVVELVLAPAGPAASQQSALASAASLVAAALHEQQ